MLLLVATVPKPTVTQVIIVPHTHYIMGPVFEFYNEHDVTPQSPLVPAASPASGRLRIYLSVVVLRLTENILFVMRIEKKAFALQYLTESHYILGQPHNTNKGNT
jgi:hypothetical protein